ncbi:MAG TPA: methyltransferase domain-containing protein [Xanthobacteraceae bacterium]|nr:methyltransferase domain-containing protein [Xanthobacteraceae bacterium]
MDVTSRQAHWQGVYSSKRPEEVSWFQETPAVSLELMRAAGVTQASSIIDVGGGASRLVDVLMDAGYQNLTVLDLSAAALAATQARLGQGAAAVTWIAADVTTWQPRETYDLWHDRAAFHFLTEPADRGAYVACLMAALKPGGHAIMATFAPDGPERCSGLPVVRYDGASLTAVLGDAFELLQTVRHAHATPMGSVQNFQFSLFRRR